MDTFSAAYVPQQTVMSTVMGAVKLVTFVGSALVAALLISQSLPVNANRIIPGDEAVLATVPFEYTHFPDVGKVASPHIATGIITETGTVPVTFLIDSGAKISALPMKYADEVGLDKETAKRIYLRSATDNTTYGYLSEVTLGFNDKHVTIPVVYAEVIEPLLGTFGFFDRYTILFDRGEQIVIKEKV